MLGLSHLFRTREIKILNNFESLHIKDGDLLSYVLVGEEGCFEGYISQNEKIISPFCLSVILSLSFLIP